MSTSKMTHRQVALILAAGKGTRMHSAKPKVLHTLLDEPMLAYVLAALKPVFDSGILVVSGHMASQVEDAFPGMDFCRQAEQLGTGHALQTAMPILKDMGAEYVLVANGDSPLLQSSDIVRFMEAAKDLDIAFATVTLDNPSAYGRVVRAGAILQGIVEARDYDSSVYGEASGEINTGLYCFRMAAIDKLLPLIKNNNKSGEYYITDLIGHGIAHHMAVEGIPFSDPTNFSGVNSPAELAELEEILRKRVTDNLLAKGVILHAPHLIRCAPEAVIEPGAEITGPCEIYGTSMIASGAQIESGCHIKNSSISAGAHILNFSHIVNAVVGEKAVVGPYARLRPNSVLKNNSHVGNFVELKNTMLGDGSKANHLSYLGDSEIGSGVNIGAGTITCNYDGKNKHKTIIGDGAFIGSNTALVAPVSVGENSLVGAGSTITGPVPKNSLAIARSRQKNLPRHK